MSSASIQSKNVSSHTGRAQARDTSSSNNPCAQPAAFPIECRRIRVLAGREPDTLGLDHQTRGAPNLIPLARSGPFGAAPCRFIDQPNSSSHARLPVNHAESRGESLLLSRGLQPAEPNNPPISRWYLCRHPRPRPNQGTRYAGPDDERHHRSTCSSPGATRRPMKPLPPRSRRKSTAIGHRDAEERPMLERFEARWTSGSNVPMSTMRSSPT